MAGDMIRGQVQDLPLQGIYRRLEREIHGLLCDMGLATQRMDEFVDQEDLVKRFIGAWNAVVEKIEKNVMKQLAAGKTKVKI